MGWAHSCSFFLMLNCPFIHKHTHAHTFTHTYAVLLSSLHPSVANVQGEENKGCGSKRWKGYQFIMELLLRVMKKT